MKKIIFLSLLFLSSINAFCQPPLHVLPRIGIVQNLENDTILVNAGYHDLVESVSKWVSPRNVTDEQFKKNLETFKRLKINLYAFNLFIPAELKLVGPDVKEAEILSYAEKVFQRCKKAKVKLIVWGSGGARRVPEGFDAIKASEQFATIARKVAGLARKYSIVLALENLNSTETNFITTARQALDMVKKVNHPNFRLCVDIYHMAKENESPNLIAETQAYIVHCDIAEKENRTPPGVAGEDFRPYLLQLREIHYTGRIVIEGRWDNLQSQAKNAYRYLSEQVRLAYMP